SIPRSRTIGRAGTSRRSRPTDPPPSGSGPTCSARRSTPGRRTRTCSPATTTSPWWRPPRSTAASPTSRSSREEPAVSEPPDPEARIELVKTDVTSKLGFSFPPVRRDFGAGDPETDELPGPDDEDVEFDFEFDDDSGLGYRRVVSFGEAGVL